MESGDFLDDEFTAAVRSAGAQARLETLKAGVPIFYHDSDARLDIMEQPDGRRFEIRFVTDAAENTDYEIVRELGEFAA